MKTISERLSPETLEASVREMWDAIAHCHADDEDRRGLIDQARAIEAKLRLRLAYQNRLDSSARTLLGFCKELVAGTGNTPALIGAIECLIAYIEGQPPTAQIPSYPEPSPGGGT